MRVALTYSFFAGLALMAAAPVSAAAAPAEPSVHMFRSEAVAILLLGIAGVLIGHRSSRSRKPGDDPKA